MVFSSPPVPFVKVRSPMDVAVILAPLPGRQFSRQEAAAIEQWAQNNGGTVGKTPSWVQGPAILLESATAQTIPELRQWAEGVPSGEQVLPDPPNPTLVMQQLRALAAQGKLGPLGRGMARLPALVTPKQVQVALAEIALCGEVES